MSAQVFSAADVEPLIRKGISSEKIDEYAAAFTLFAVQDATGAYRITLDSLRNKLCGDFAQTFTDEDLKYMLRQFNPKGTEVDFETFASSLHDKLNDARFNEAFGDAFDIFDTAKTGELTKADLMAGMNKLGENLTEQEADEMLKIAKKKDDFVRSMTQSLAVSNGGGSSGGGGTTNAATPAATTTTTATPGPGTPGPGPGPGRPTGPGGPGPGTPGPGRPTGPGGPGPGPGPGRPTGPGGPGPGGPPRPPGGPGGPGGPPRPPGGPGSPGVPRPPRPGG